MLLVPPTNRIMNLKSILKIYKPEKPSAKVFDLFRGLLSCLPWVFQGN